MLTSSNWIGRLDVRLHHDVLQLRTGWLTTFLRAVTTVGGGATAVAVVIAIGVIASLRKHSPWSSFAAVGALLLGLDLRTVLNHWIARPRPPTADWLTGASGYAMPSGHSANSVMAYGFALALLWSHLSPRWRQAGVVLVAVIALLVGTSRVYLGVHWPSDVVGGWAFGAAWLVLSLTVWQRVTTDSRTGHI